MTNRYSIFYVSLFYVDYELREPPGGSNQSNPPPQPTDWLVYNVDNGQALGEPSAEGLPGYLIITSSDIYSDASSEALQTKNALDAFKAHKESRGFNVVIQTEEAWLTVPDRGGQEATEDLRAYLASNYETENWKYVLLIGSPRGDSFMPMKEVWPSNTGHQWWAELPQYSGYVMHTDYYYAELTGNWDLDGDGLAGEFGHYSDPIPPYTKTGDFGTTPEGETGIDRDHELIVGRIPFYPESGTAHDDLVSILNKTIAYQTTLASEMTWREKTLLIAQHPQQYFFGEQIRDGVLSQSPTMDSYRVYNADCLSPTDTCDPVISDPTYQVDQVCNSTSVTHRWANDKPGVVTWFSHGSPTSAAGVFGTYNIDSLDTLADGATQEIDDTPVFTFQASCLTAQPLHQNNLAFALLKKGAVATLGATEKSYGPYSPVPIANTAAITGLAYEYLKSVIVDRMPAGDALFDVKKRVPVTNHFWHYWVNLNLFNLYGDPEVSLYDHQALYAFEMVPLPNQQLQVGEAFSATLQVTTEAPAYDIAFSEKPDWLDFNSETLVLSGTPSEADLGQHVVSLLVGNGPNAIHQNFIVSVERANLPPTYEGETVVYMPVSDTPFRFNLLLTDPEFDRLTVTYQYERPPDWVDLEVLSDGREDNSGVATIEERDRARENFDLVFYTSDEVSGSHEVMVSVSDGRHQVAFTLLVHVCGADVDIDGCDSLPDACASAPCLNNGVCVADDEEGYICLCAEGYQGQYCESKVEASDAGVVSVDAGADTSSDAGATEDTPDAGGR